MGGFFSIFECVLTLNNIAKHCLQNCSLLLFFQRPLIAEVMQFRCPNRMEECNRYFSFEDDAIFVWSTDICIADEIFHRLLISRGKRESFLATFCYEMTTEYQLLYAKSAPFVSCAVFIDCLFSWIINWDIDYRGLDAIDPWCQYNPKRLGCDGVHVGVALKFLSKFKPITDNDKPDTKSCRHRRFDRTLLQGTSERHRRLRTYLNNYCTSVLGSRGKVKDKTTARNKEKNKHKSAEKFQRCALTENEIINLNNDFRFKKIFHGIFDKVYQKELLKKMVSLVWTFSKSAALLAFFPWDKILTFKNIFENYKTSNPNFEELNNSLQDLRVQFADVMTSAIRHHKTEEIADFFLYVIDEIVRIHTDDQNVMPDQPENVAPYNPSQGTAYYFTSHGNQIRRTPNYQMDGTC